MKKKQKKHFVFDTIVNQFNLFYLQWLHMLIVIQYIYIYVLVYSYQFAMQINIIELILVFV